MTDVLDFAHPPPAVHGQTDRQMLRRCISYTVLTRGGVVQARIDDLYATIELGRIG